jgi:hypothetical protein
MYPLAPGRVGRFGRLPVVRGVSATAALFHALVRRDGVFAAMAPVPTHDEAAPALCRAVLGAGGISPGHTGRLQWGWVSRHYGCLKRVTSPAEPLT